MSTEADSYQLVRCLRTTETSEAYEATHPTLPGRFLVELFSPGQDASALEWFEAELASLAEAAHPNVLTVVGLGKLPDGKSAAIWELPGGTLAEWLHRGRSASAEAALGVVAGIAQALSAAHGRGIAHERVSPENIFLVEDADLGRGGVKLGGFGMRWLTPGGPSAGWGAGLRISADLAGLADIAERLLAPLDLPSDRLIRPLRPIRSKGGSQTASQVISRARGHGAGAPFGSALELSEALAVAVRAQVDEASADGFEPVARPSNDERTEPMNQDGSGEGHRHRRFGLTVARIGAATLGTVVTVLVVGMLVDPASVPIPAERPPAKVPVAQALPAVPPAPPAAPPAPAPVPAPVAARPAEQAVVAEEPPKVVTVAPPDRARSSQRARRGLVWSSRLQKLVTVEEASREAERARSAAEASGALGSKPPLTAP
jgi:hypothetical protein